MKVSSRRNEKPNVTKSNYRPYKLEGQETFKVFARWGKTFQSQKQWNK